MESICRLSGEAFHISDADLAFYKRLGVPVPSLCPKERSRRRNAFRNENNLYWRNCDASGQKLLTQYAPETKIIIYDEPIYFSDAWDAKSYAREFDFNRSFFEQWYELKQVVPHLPSHSTFNENTEYCSYAGWNKDCYLVFHADHNRDSLYLSHGFYNVDCLDCYYVNRSELCYEAVTSESCYNCSFIRDCTNCSDSYFLKSCIGCSHCFGCVNLRNKSYCFFNQQMSKEEYQRTISDLQLDSYQQLNQQKKRFQEFVIEQPQKSIQGTHIENSTGDYLRWCKNVLHSFHCENCKDCSYISDCSKCVDCYDVDSWGGTGAELLYECETVGEGAHNILFTSYCFDGVSDIMYSYNCQSSSNLFGCIGMRHEKYCIFNTQYTPEQFEQLKNKIIAHMKRTGEWGEYFPVAYSPFAYNETVANEYHPLSREEVLKRGWKWRDQSELIDQNVPVYSVPDSISSVKDDVIDYVLVCESTGKKFRITQQELKFYRRLGLPLPRNSYHARHLARVAQTNPRELYSRSCDMTGLEITSTFHPSSIEKVFCEEAYLQVVE